MFDPESVWELRTADTLAFGAGAAAELPARLPDGAGSVLLVTDPGVREAGVVAHLLDVLDDRRPDLAVDVFDDVASDPALGVFAAAVDRVRESAPDAVVGVGGGSALDVAKVAGAVGNHGGDVLDYVAPPTGAGDPVPGPGLPTVAVPTTAGTGSEATPVAVVSLPDRDLKVGISSRHLLPDAALIDPLLTVSLPPGPTAAAGMDALAHAVEAYTTRPFDAKPRADPAERPDYGGRTPLTDALARVAVRRIGSGLRRAVDNGEDLDARRDVALGSLAAGVAFANAGLGAAHAVAMAAGAAHDTPHGETVAAVLPAVMRYNAPSVRERYRDVARWLGRDVAGTDPGPAAAAAADAVAELAADVGAPDGLGALGVSPDDVPALAAKTTTLSRLLAGNPRRVDEDAAAEICRDAL
ncbi:MAG: hydroxyacid-oxoacid transhydrogenase [Haloferacaceae archaeon]